MLYSGIMPSSNSKPISPDAAKRREKNRESDGKFGESARPDAPKLRVSKGGIKWGELQSMRVAQRNPNNETLDTLMRSTTELQFNKRDNVMRGVWEILRTDDEMATMVPVLWGLTGEGKTSALLKYAEGYGCKTFHINCACLNVGETEGIPFIANYDISDDGEMEFAGIYDDSQASAKQADQRIAIHKGLFLWLAQPIEWAKANPESLCILFLDEINRAPEGVMHDMMLLLSQREVNGQKLPDNLRLVAAANPSSTDSAVNELSPAQRARLVHLDWPDVDHRADDRVDWGYPVLEPTEYYTQNADGSEVSIADYSERLSRFNDLRNRFLDKFVVYRYDRGVDAGEQFMTKDQAQLSQIEGETAFGHGRGWTEGLRMLTQLTGVPAWTKDSAGHSVVDEIPGNWDKGLGETVLGGYVGKEAAAEYFRWLPLTELPSAKEWLMDLEGAMIVNLESADKVAIMAQSMSRTFKTNFDEVTDDAQGVEQVATMIKSWVVFLDRHKPRRIHASPDLPNRTIRNLASVRSRQSRASQQCCRCRYQRHRMDE